MKKFLLITSCFTLVACASIISGTSQTIEISSNPENIVVTTTPGDYKVTSPGQLTVPRIRGPYILTFKKEGYSTVEIRLERKTNGWVWGNLLIGGVIGIMIDFGNGSAYKLNPEKVHANLTKMPPKIQILNEPSSMLIFDKSGSLLFQLTAKK